MSDGSSGVGWIISLTAASAIGLALYVSYQSDLRIQREQQEARREAEEARRLREQELAAEQNRIDALSPVDRDIYALQYLRYLLDGHSTVEDNPEFPAFRAWSTALALNMPQKYQEFIDDFPDAQWTEAAQRVLSNLNAEMATKRSDGDDPVFEISDVISEASSSWLEPIGDLEVELDGYIDCSNSQSLQTVDGYAIVRFFYASARQAIADRFELSTESSVFIADQNIDSLMRGETSASGPSIRPNVSVKTFLLSLENRELEQLIDASVPLLGDNAHQIRSYLAFLLDQKNIYENGGSPQLAYYGRYFLGSQEWIEPQIDSDEECFRIYQGARLTHPDRANWVGIVDWMPSPDLAAQGFWRRRTLEGSQERAERLLRYAIRAIDEAADH